MEATESYQVNLEVFQGPLDLLLFLIKKQKIDIHDIPVAVITSEYLKYLNQKERINLDREAEFLFMAALLIYIKSQMLLPREKIPEEEDPRQPLVNRLLDYQQIKAIRSLLKKKEDEEQLKWKRNSRPPVFENDDLEIEEVSLFELAEMFLKLMRRREMENTRVLKRKDFSVEDKTSEILALLKENSCIDFLDYFRQQESLEEALVAFFGILELIKARVVIAIQERLFHSIKIWLIRDHSSGQKT